MPHHHHTSFNEAINLIAVSSGRYITHTIEPSPLHEVSSYDAILSIHSSQGVLWIDRIAPRADGDASLCFP